MNDHKPARTLALVAVGALAAVFFMNGGTAASWFPHVGGARDALGLDEAQLSFVLMALPAGLVLTGPLVPLAIRLIGLRGTLAVSMALYAAGIGVAGAMSSSSTAGVAAGLFLAGAANVGVDIAMNTLSGQLERERGKTLNAYFQAAFSVGQLAGAFAAGLVIQGGAGAWPHLGVVAAIGVMLAVAAPLALPRHRAADADVEGDGAPGDGGHGHGGGLGLRLSRRTLLLAAVGFSAMMVEGVVADWSSVFVRDDQHRPELAGWAYTAFAACMVLGRLVSPRLADRIGLSRLVAFGASAVAGGGVVVVAAPTAAVAILGFGIVGLGAAGIVPAVNTAIGDSPRELATVTTICYAGFFVGPPLIGFVAHATSIGVALVTIPVLALVVWTLSGSVVRKVRWRLGPVATLQVSDASANGRRGPWDELRWADVAQTAARALREGTTPAEDGTLRVAGAPGGTLFVAVRPAGPGEDLDALVALGRTAGDAVRLALGEGERTAAWFAEGHDDVPRYTHRMRQALALLGAVGADQGR